MIRQASSRLRNGLFVIRLLPIYLLLGFFKHFVPLRSLARWAWHAPVGLRDRAAERRMTAGVLRLSKLTGLLDRDCLQRSLLLYRVLSRAGATPILVIGFQRTDTQIVGHAWVTVDGQPVFEQAKLLSFAPAFGFGVQGALLFSAQLSAMPE